MHTETVTARVDFTPGERWRGEDGTEYNYRVLTGVYTSTKQDSGMGQFKGSAYVYTLAGAHPPSDPLDTDFATFMVKLQPHALAMNDYFGASVSVEHGVLAVGA